MPYKILTFLNKSVHYFENVFKKLRKLSKCPTLMKKTSIHLKIILKSLDFFEKTSHHFKKSLNSIENVFKIFEKASYLFLKPSFL
jgi:hypothetical protein